MIDQRHNNGKYWDIADIRNPETELLNLELYLVLSKFLSKLSRWQEKVLRMRFGIAGEKTHSLREVALILGASPYRINYIEKRALKALRDLGCINQLNQYKELL